MRLRLLCLMLVATATLEVGLHFWLRSRIPDDSDYRRASERVASELTATDALSVAPTYIEANVRHLIGDQLSLAMIGRPDLAAFRRLWTITLAGHQAADRPASPPEFEHDFGGVVVRRFALPEPTVVEDLATQLAHAEVSSVRRDQERPCRWVESKAGPGGGLGHGTIEPPHRFVCSSGRDGMVASIIVEDMQLNPRHCIWQPAQMGRTTRVRFSNLTLSDRLVVHAGLYYEHERDGIEEPVSLRIRIDGALVHTLVHNDGDGFVRATIPTKSGQVATVEFEAHSNRRSRPGFCWSATTRRGGP